MPSHLDLPASLRSPTRRARGSGGSPPVRSSRREHAESLTEEFEAIPIRSIAVEAVDPDLVFKFSAASRLSERALEAEGIEVLGEDETWTYFVLVDDAARRRFLSSLSAFGATDRGRVPNMTATLAAAIETIDGIEPYGPEDRLTLDLQGLAGNETTEVHVRLWPAANEQEAAEWVARATQVIESISGCEVLASSSRPQTAAVEADVSREGLALLSQLSVVEKVTSPIHFTLTNSQIEEAEPPRPVPEPRGAAIGVLDDGPTTVNPLVAAVLADSASFPSPAEYPWNPPGPHGTAVASVAAFYDFEDHISVGTSLRRPHPIFAARVMEPRTRGLLTSAPRGVVFHDCVERAVRWVHAQGARVVNMSVNKNGAAPIGGPRDELSFVLDGLARELDIVVVLSAGNTATSLHHDHVLGMHVDHDYPAYLSEPDAGIGEPGLAANALTVGGQARTNLCGVPGYLGVAPTGGPSPFTRTGVNAGRGRGKPDLVHWAGNWGWNDHLGMLHVSESSLSVIVAASEPGRTYDSGCGTSFAAPRVAHIAAEVLTRYPESSANLVRALVLLSSRHPEGLYAVLPDRADRRRVAGAGRPDVDRAVESGGYRAVLTFQGSMACDTTVVHPVPIPVEYTRGRRHRRIRIAVACDPPVRRTRREYVAGHLQVALLRNVREDEMLNIFRQQPSAQARNSDPSLTAVPLPQDRRRLGLYPGSNDVTRTTAYVSEFSTVQLQEDDGDTYYVAVTHQRSPWQNLTGYDEQKYAIAVELIDEGVPALDLHNLVRARLETRIRPRVS